MQVPAHHLSVPDPTLVPGEEAADEVAPTTTVEKQDMERGEQEDRDWAWKEFMQNLRLVRGEAVPEGPIPNPVATGSAAMEKKKALLANKRRLADSLQGAADSKQQKLEEGAKSGQGKISLPGGSRAQAPPSIPPGEVCVRQQVSPSPRDTVDDAPKHGGKKVEKQKSSKNKVEKWVENLAAIDEFDEIRTESIISEDTVAPPAYSPSPQVQVKLKLVTVMLEKVKVPSLAKKLFEEDEEADQVQEGQHGGDCQQGSFLFGSPR